MIHSEPFNAFSCLIASHGKIKMGSIGIDLTICWCFRHFFFLLFSLYNTGINLAPLIPFHRLGNWGIKILSDLPSVLQLVNNRASIQTCTHMPCFIVLHFITLCSYCFFFFFNNLKVWQACGCHLSDNVCSACVSVSRFGYSHNTSTSFIIITFVMVTCGQWSLMLLS